MDCAHARLLLLDHARGRLETGAAGDLEAHLAGCETCRRALDAERELEAALRRQLPRPAAPASLRRRLEQLVADAGAPAAARPARVLRPPAWRRWVVPALAAGLAALATATALQLGRRGPEDALAALAGEAVNDHLRVLVRERPVDLESGLNHQVKPWFEGRLDFAPVVPQPQVPDLRLDGGAVGYFLDRKAAVVAYHLRRHVVTLLAFRADGLTWPGEPGQVLRAGLRGFQVVFWREGDVGYALVSDISAAELGQLADRFAAAAAG